MARAQRRAPQVLVRPADRFAVPTRPTAASSLLLAPPRGSSFVIQSKALDLANTLALTSFFFQGFTSVAKERMLNMVRLPSVLTVRASSVLTMSMRE